MTARFASALALCLFAAVPAAGQTFRPPDPTSRPWATAGLTLGPIYFAPTFEVRDVGVDNNVFNDRSNPKSDLTGTLAVRSLFGLHFGESLVLQVTQDNRYIYFRRYRSERSIDSGLGAVLEWRTEKFRPWLKWSKAKSSQRVNDEIDHRADRKFPDLGGGFDLDAAFRLGLSMAVRRASLTFADTEEFNGVNLADVMNNTSTQYQAFLRYEISELSDFILGADYQRDRFKTRPDRDNNAYYYYAGLRTRQGAQWVGDIGVGFRQMDHTQAGIPNFNGVTASANIALIPSEYFKFEFGGGRDVAYTYLEAFPFIVDSRASLTATSRVIDHMDIVASGRAHWAHYGDSLDGTAVPYTERTDVFSIGVGYYVGGGNGTRIGLQFERAARTSPEANRQYRTNRLSTSYRFSF